MPVSSRNEFTDKEDSYLVQYIGKYCPEVQGRSGNKLFDRLVENEKGLWPWAKAHTSQSWRERYIRRKDTFDERIKKWQAKHLANQSNADAGPSSPLGTHRVPQTPKSYARQSFTPLDDQLLVQYLAIETPDGAHRKGNAVYQRLVSQPDRWPWGSRHTAQSWLERYRKRSAQFNAQIRDYQDKHGIQRTGTVRRELWEKLAMEVSQDKQLPERAKKSRVDSGSLKSKKRSATDDGEETDGERRKRRRLEKRKMVEVAEEEEEEGMDDASAPARPLDSPSRPASDAGTGTSGRDAAEALNILNSSLVAQQRADRSVSPARQAIEPEQGATRFLPNIAHTIPATQESYVVPSPETLKQSTSRARPPKVSQEPTPPTSDAAQSLSSQTPTKTPSYEPKPQAASPSQRLSTSARRTVIDTDEEDRQEGREDARLLAALPRRQKRSQPPVRIEGAFNSAIARHNGANSYEGSRRVSGVEEVSDPELEPVKGWPPKRGKGRDHVGVVRKANASAVSSDGRNVTTHLAPGRNVPSSSTPLAKHRTRSAASLVSDEAQLYPPPDTRASPQKSTKLLNQDVTTPRPRTTTIFSGHQRPNGSGPTITDTAERRHTLATPAVHRRVERLRTRARHSMPAFGKRYSGASPDVTNTSYRGRLVTAEDYQHAFEFGMRGILKEIASSIGFSYEVVENVWALCGTIADTKAILNRMRANAEETAREAYEALAIREKVEERERRISEGLPIVPVRSDAPAGISTSSVRRAEADTEQYWPPENSKAAILLQERMEQGDAEDEEDAEEAGNILSQEAEESEVEQGRELVEEDDRALDEEVESEMSGGEEEHEEEGEEDAGPEEEDEKEAANMLSQDFQDEKVARKRESIHEDEPADDDSVPSENGLSDEDSYDLEHEDFYKRVQNILRQVKSVKSD